MARLIFFFLICLYSLTAQSQNISFHHTTSNGLVSNHVYCVFQDSKGYIWFGTYHGVSRFDGKEFVNFSMMDGLPNNDIFVISEDPEGRIWFASYVNELCYFEKDSIFKYKYNDKLDEILDKKTVKLSLHIDEKRNLLLGDAMHGLIKIDSSGNIENISEEKRNVYVFDDLLLTSHDKWKTKKPWRKGIYRINFYKDIVFDTVFEQPFDHKKNNLETGGNHYASKYGLDTTLVSFGSLFITKSNSHIDYKILNYRIEDLYVDSKKSIWFGTWNNGAHCYSDQSIKNELFHLLAGNTVTDILQDFQGGYWFTTLNNGIYHYPSLNKDLTNNQLPKERVRQLIKGKDDILFIAYDNGEVWYSDFQEAGIVAYLEEEIQRESNHIYYDETLNRLYTKGKVIYKGDQFEIEKIPMFKASEPTSKSYSMFKLSDTLYHVRHKGIYTSEPKFSRLKFGSQFETNKIQCIEEMGDSAIFGSLNGAFVISSNSIKTFLPELNDYKITSLSSRKDHLIISAEGKGMYVIKGNEINLIESIDAHKAPKIFSTNLTEEGLLLIGTTAGLYYISDINSSLEVKKLSAQQAHISGSIHQVISDKDNFYLGTENGLVILEIEILKKEIIPPKSYITLTKINGHPANFVSGSELNYDQNSLEINFSSIDYGETENLIHAWKFDRPNEKWNETKNSNIYFDGIRPGKYKILTKAYSVPGNWSNVSEILFTIRPAWWTSWYFLSVSILGFTALIIFVLYSRDIRLKKKAALDLFVLRDKNELEMKALRAQMNPHFIFNALSAIQYLIQSNQNKKAQHFLVKFSQLLRRVTDTSQDHRITLKEELDILQTYVDLQNLRFNNKFEYNVTINSSLKAEKILIPGLILQPFVENAIQHGLSKRPGNGKLTIDINKEKEQLHFSIIDDGIGREKSQKLKVGSESEKKSIGMSNVSNRLDILNYENKNSEGSVSVTDLMNDEGIACGTRIDLFVKYETYSSEHIL